MKPHQISTFFMIAFAISWGLWFSLDPVINKGLEMLVPLVSLELCRLGLARIIVTRICNNKPKFSSTTRQWITYLIALGLSTMTFYAHHYLISQDKQSLLMDVFVLVMAIPFAYILSAAFSSTPAVQRYLTSLIQERGIRAWLLLASYLPSALFTLLIVISNLSGRQSVGLSDHLYTGLTLLNITAIKFFQLFFYNATEEETGMRGIAFMLRVDWSVHSVVIYDFTTFVILPKRMWQKLPFEHPAVIQLAVEAPNWQTRVQLELA